MRMCIIVAFAALGLLTSAVPAASASSQTTRCRRDKVVKVRDFVNQTVVTVTATFGYDVNKGSSCAFTNARAGSISKFHSRTAPQPAPQSTDGRLKIVVYDEVHQICAVTRGIVGELSELSSCATSG